MLLLWTVSTCEDGAFLAVSICVNNSLSSTASVFSLFTTVCPIHSNADSGNSLSIFMLLLWTVSTCENGAFLAVSICVNTSLSSTTSVFSLSTPVCPIHSNSASENLLSILMLFLFFLTVSTCEDEAILLVVSVSLNNSISSVFSLSTPDSENLLSISLLLFLTVSACEDGDFVVVSICVNNSLSFTASVFSLSTPVCPIHSNSASGSLLSIFMLRLWTGSACDDGAVLFVVSMCVNNSLSFAASVSLRRSSCIGVFEGSESFISLRMATWPVTCASGVIGYLIISSWESSLVWIWNKSTCFCCCLCCCCCCCCCCCFCSCSCFCWCSCSNCCSGCCCCFCFVSTSVFVVVSIVTAIASSVLVEVPFGWCTGWADITFSMAGTEVGCFLSSLFVKESVISSVPSLFP